MPEQLPPSTDELGWGSTPLMPDVIVLSWRQYRLERRMFWRNPSAAFFNFLLPLLFLIGGGAILHGNQHDLNKLVPAIAGMSVMSTTFTALAYNIVFLRERGVLKRIRGTPLPTSSYFGGVAANAVTNTALQIAIVVLAGRIFFGIGWPAHWDELVVFVALGVVCFAALGVAFAHVIPNFESTAAYVNAVFLPVVFISFFVFDSKSAPGFLRTIAEALPLKPLIDGLSGAMVAGSGLPGNLDALAVIGLWGVFGLCFAVRGFSWEQSRT
jgi:ABC-2 type transport system permease protein